VLWKRNHSSQTYANPANPSNLGDGTGRLVLPGTLWLRGAAGLRAELRVSQCVAGAGAVAVCAASASSGPWSGRSVSAYSTWSPASGSGGCGLRCRRSVEEPAHTDGALVPCFGRRWRSWGRELSWQCLCHRVPLRPGLFTWLWAASRSVTPRSPSRPRPRSQGPAGRSSKAAPSGCAG